MCVVLTNVAGYICIVIKAITKEEIWVVLWSIFWKKTPCEKVV
jgi:hypothetical protein